MKQHIHSVRIAFCVIAAALAFVAGPNGRTARGQDFRPNLSATLGKCNLEVFVSLIYCCKIVSYVAQCSALPRGPRCRNDFFNAHSRNTTAKLLAIDLIAISEEELWRSLFREGLNDLLCGPQGGRMGRHIGMHNLPPVME
jgi:hypothetical protein